MSSASLPAGVSLSTLLRSLSIFIFQLQNACRPGEANYDVCLQASKSISATLDEIVNGLHTPVNMDEVPQNAVAEDGDAGMVGFGILPPDILDGFDFSSWAQSIDWTATGAEWSTL